MPYSYFPNDVMMSLERILVAQKSGGCGTEVKKQDRGE